MQNETNTVEDLFSKTTDYLETKAELWKLKAIGKASDMASSFVSKIAIVLVSCLVIVLLNIAIAIWLGSLLGELYLGFFIITAFNLLVLIILYTARKYFLKTPFKNAFIKHFFN